MIIEDRINRIIESVEARAASDPNDEALKGALHQLKTVQDKQQKGTPLLISDLQALLVVCRDVLIPREVAHQVLALQKLKNSLRVAD